MRTHRQNLKTLWHDRQGATAVEAAFILPIIVTILFGVMQISLAFYDISMTKNTLDESVRQILLVQSPTDADIDEILTNNIHSSTISEITTSTSYETKFGAEYANISASISYAVAIPFTDGISIDKNMTSTIILNR